MILQVEQETVSAMDSLLKIDTVKDRMCQVQNALRVGPLFLSQLFSPLFANLSDLLPNLGIGQLDGADARH